MHLRGTPLPLGLVAMLVALLASPLAAGAESAAFNEGLRAYDAGDYRAAHRVWRGLAETGDAEAQSALAGLYMAGFGVRWNSVEGARWYARAARQGHTIAQLNLGDFYARGVGVKRDLGKAYLWLSLAAAKGNAWAADRRNRIAKRMTRRQRAAALKMLKAWRPQPERR